MYADVKGAPGLQELSDLFDNLFGQVNCGNGKTLVSHSINGKSYGWAVNTTVQEAFSAVGEALRQLKTDSAGAVVQTSADFSQLQR